jgi:hypothetical protein
VLRGALAFLGTINRFHLPTSTISSNHEILFMVNGSAFLAFLRPAFVGAAYRAILMFKVPGLRRVRGGVCVLFGVLLSGFHLFGQFVVNDTVVSSLNVSLIDPEFADASQLMSWQDTDGRLWLNHVDPTTGTWSPMDGRQWLLDDQLARVAGTRQGPEWVVGRGDDRIVYTKNVGGILTLYEAWNRNRQWFTAPLPLNFYCSAMRGSKEVGDPRD